MGGFPQGVFFGCFPPGPGTWSVRVSLCDQGGGYGVAPGGSQRLPTPCREVGSSPPEGGLKVHLGRAHSGVQSSTDVGATHEVEKQAPLR